MHTNFPCRKVYIADPSAVYINSNLSEKGCDHDILYHILSNKRGKNAHYNLPYRLVFTIILFLVKSS